MTYLRLSARSIIGGPWDKKWHANTRIFAQFLRATPMETAAPVRKLAME